MIHDPLAMTSSVPSVHNIRICIPRITTRVRICPRLKRQTFPTHYCSIHCPLAPSFGKGSFMEGKGAKCTLEAQRKKLSFELVACLARAADKLNQLEVGRSGRREFIHYRVKLVKLHNEQWCKYGIRSLACIAWQGYPGHAFAFHR